MTSKIACRDAILRPKSPPRRSGASLERSSGCRSAPRMRSGRSKDTPGTFPECSRVLSGRSWDAFGASRGILEPPRKHILAKFTRNSIATWFGVRFWRLQTSKIVISSRRNDDFHEIYVPPETAENGGPEAPKHELGRPKSSRKARPSASGASKK